MKSSSKCRVVEIENKLKMQSKLRKIARVIYIDGQEDFDGSSLKAEVIFMHPYNSRFPLPKGLSYPEAFKNGPIIIWN